MKSTRLILATLTASAALPAAGLFAQTAPTSAAAPTATPSVSAPASTAKADAEDEEEAGHGTMARFKALTPEEQAKLRAANKAARKDPAFIAAKAERKTNPKAFREARRAAMLKADPSVGPILEKMKEARRERRNKA